MIYDSIVKHLTIKSDRNRHTSLEHMPCNTLRNVVQYEEEHNFLYIILNITTTLQCCTLISRFPFHAST